MMSGLYYCGIAKWDNGEEALKRAIEAAKTVGDLRTYEECTLHLGTIYYFRGDLKKTCEFTDEALQSASRRGDIQTQISAAVAEARNNYAKGEYVKCLASLESAKVGIESIGASDISTELNYCALAALINLRQRKSEQFWFFSEAAFGILSKTEPTLYSTYFGYSWMVECYMLIALDTTYLDDGKIPLSKSKLVNKVEKALQFLSKFSEVFPFAEASRQYWKGAIQHLNNKKEKAKQYFSKALEVTKTFGITFEQALIMHSVGLLTQNTDLTNYALNSYPELQFRTTNLSALKSTLTIHKSIDTTSDTMQWKQTEST